MKAQKHNKTKEEIIESLKNTEMQKRYEAFVEEYESWKEMARAKYGMELAAQVSFSPDTGVKPILSVVAVKQDESKEEQNQSE